MKTDNFYKHVLFSEISTSGFSNLMVDVKNISILFRKDTQNNKCFFSGRTSKRGGGQSPKTTKQRTPFFIKGRNYGKKYEPLM